MAREMIAMMLAYLGLHAIPAADQSANHPTKHSIRGIYPGMTVPELTKKMEKLKADCKPVPTAFDTVCTLASDKFPDGHELHYTFRVDFTRGLVPQQVRFVAFDFGSNRTFDDIKEN